MRHWIGWVCGVGVGCSTPCDELEVLRTEVCGLVPARDPAPAECGRRSVAACEAECGLIADCLIHEPPTAMNSGAFADFLEAVDVYDSCVEGCGG